MLIDYRAVSTQSPLREAVFSDNKSEIAKMIVEMYITNPKLVTEAIGKLNVIRCHKRYLNEHYNTFERGTRRKSVNSNRR